MKVIPTFYHRFLQFQNKIFEIIYRTFWNIITNFHCLMFSIIYEILNSIKIFFLFQAAPQITNNVEQKLDITFIESVHGVKRNIECAYLKKCPSCNGKSQRLVGRTNSELCRKCNGSGQLSKKTATYTSLSVCDRSMSRKAIH